MTSITNSTHCRLCTKVATSSSFPIFSLKNGRLIADMVTIICPIKIDISDNFSKTICGRCLNIITQAIQLREKSVESDENFKKQIKNVQVKIETDPFRNEIWLNSEDNQSIEKEQQKEIKNYLPKLKQKISKVSCNICGLELSHANNLKRHILSCHDKSLEFPCKECSYRFKSQIRLHTHIEKFHQISSNKSFNIQTHSKSQTAVETPEQVINFSCYQCNKTFTIKQNLNRHLKKIHFNSKPKEENSKLVKKENEKCKYCVVKFNGNKFKYEQHLVDAHKEKLQHIYSCDFCPKQFVFLTSLEIHIEVHKMQRS
ncbi:hypothetical protein PVAND_014579 [Polypedilum vanderplanki]|uniref:Zinc finger protein n=1 Tax=Polypedilum vanderplanki TaxID=319348 RepID=A0A9J6B9K9_POLVA|nr:hypothetical protein PVAND_014579 [Polypedilum vanderplanki]